MHLWGVSGSSSIYISILEVLKTLEATSLEQATQESNVISPFFWRDLPGGESTLYRGSIFAQRFICFEDAYQNELWLDGPPKGLTYIPSSAAFLAVRGAGDDRPEPIGGADGCPTPDSSAIIQIVETDKQYHCVNFGEDRWKVDEVWYEATRWVSCLPELD